MLLHLVRHACAGDKREWDGPDDERPLDRAGLLQAAALDELFAPVPPSQVRSSPSRRCVQTLEPLARRHGLDVDTADQLRTGVDVDELLAYLAGEVADGAVLCTHGEVLEGLLPLLPPAAARQRDELLTKGGVWTLTIEPGDPLAITDVRHHVPSSIRSCARHERP